MPTKAELQAKCEQLERDNAELVRQLQRMGRQLSGQLLPARYLRDVSGMQGGRWRLLTRAFTSKC